MAPGKRSDPAKIKREQAAIRRDIARRKNEAARKAEQRANLDNRRPPAVSPPSGRVVQPGWKRRKPIIKGGAVIGQRKGGNTA